MFVAEFVLGRLSAGTRLGWLDAVTVVVILATSQILCGLAEFEGEPISADGAAARLAEVALALYSVVVFATLAGMIRAYFLDRRRNQQNLLEDR